MYDNTLPHPSRCELHAVILNSFSHGWRETDKTPGNGHLPPWWFWHPYARATSHQVATLAYFEVSSRDYLQTNMLIASNEIVSATQLQIQITLQTNMFVTSAEHILCWGRTLLALEMIMFRTGDEHFNAGNKSIENMCSSCSHTHTHTHTHAHTHTHTQLFSSKGDIFTIISACSLTGHNSLAKVGGVACSLGSLQSIQLQSDLYMNSTICNGLSTHLKPGLQYINSYVYSTYRVVFLSFFFNRFEVGYSLLACFHQYLVSMLFIGPSLLEIKFCTSFFP